nr:hypothetical protein [Paenibacillus ginsengihumi]
MLHFVQQFERNWLQIREHRPKCCTKCNFEPQTGGTPPFLLYKIQHLRILLNILQGSQPFFIIGRCRARAWASIFTI